MTWQVESMIKQNRNKNKNRTNCDGVRDETGHEEVAVRRGRSKKKVEMKWNEMKRNKNNVQSNSLLTCEFL